MKRLFGSCTILFLGIVALQAVAPAEEAPGLDGVWFATVTPIDCTTHMILPNAPAFRGLYMFGHDGSLTNEAAFPVPNLRSSGVGAWRHTQAQMYTGAFRFFRYAPDGSFLTLRLVTSSITLDGDHFVSTDKFQDFDANNNPVTPAPGTSGCNVVMATKQ